jgi:hypothetical protein
MKLLGDVGQIQARIVHLHIVQISTQDMWMVCTERTVVS